jgi:RNA polymerase sigma-70 factor (ECF subfamily)
MRTNPAEPSLRSEPVEGEAELIERAAAGDQEAARRLVEQHFGPLTSFAFRMVGNAAEAEDIAQETMLRMWKELPGWEPRARLTTWLHRVAHNLCIDRLRAGRNMAFGPAPEQEDPRASVATQLEERELTAAVAGAMTGLPERQRAAVTLVYHQGMSNRQAAEVLGVDVDALESLLARGRANLRKRLTGEQLAQDAAGESGS